MKNTNRSKKLIKNIIGSGLSRLVNLGFSVIMLPMVVGSVVEADYALISVALSFAGFVSYADLGMGLAIVNLVAKERSCKNDEEARRVVYITWSALVFVSLFIVAACLIAIIILHKHKGIYFSLIATIIVAIGIPSGIIQRILFARQKINTVNNWATLGKFLSLAIVYASKNNGNIYAVLLANIGIPVFFGWLMMVLYFSTEEFSYLKPKYKLYKYKDYSKIIYQGVIFMTMQLLPFMEYGADLLLVSAILGINNIQAYDVNQKLFMYVISLVSVVAFPLWPAITNALSSGDSKWANKIKNKSYLIIGVCSIAVAFILVVYNENIVYVWVKRKYSIDFSVIVLMAISVVLSCLGMVQSTILNGMGLVREQGVIYWWYIGVLLILKCAALYLLGINGAVLSLCLLCFCRIIYLEFRYGFKLKAGN